MKNFLYFRRKLFEHEKSQQLSSPNIFLKKVRNPYISGAKLQSLQYKKLSRVIEMTGDHLFFLDKNLCIYSFESLL